MPKDYKGQKFNKLTLISPIGPGGGTRGHLWMAACDCGNAVEVVGKDVAAGRVQSCSKCPKGLRKPAGGYRARNAEEARLRRLLERTAKEALRKGIQFDLSLNDINTLTMQDCYICSKRPVIGTMSVELVEPVQGYTVGNCKPICRTCKRHMAGDNLRDYLAYLSEITIL